jgi:hypothetical protein
MGCPGSTQKKNSEKVEWNKSNGFETPSSNSINGRTNDINIYVVDYL